MTDALLDFAVAHYCLIGLPLLGAGLVLNLLAAARNSFADHEQHHRLH
jgi:hypothetical protein